MASKIISDLEAAAALTGDELFEVSQLSGTITITAATISALASDDSYNDSATGFVSAGFVVGDRVKVTGFTGDVVNNIFVGVVTALTAGKMTIDPADIAGLVDDAAGESVTISKWVSRRASLPDIIPAGGTTDQALVKVSGTDYDYDWGDVASGGGGGGGGGLYKIVDRKITTAAQASVTFTGIAGYEHLKVVAVHRAASTAPGMELTLNGDSGANQYDFERLIAGAAADTLNTTMVRLLQCTSADRADLFATSEIDFPFAVAAKDKRFYAVQNKSEGEPITFGCTYDSTAPITSITFTPETGSGGFVAGCEFILYGVLAENAAGYASATATDATTARTLLSADSGTYMRFTNAAAKAVTIEPEATNSIPADTEFHIRNVGAGDLTLTEGAGVTFNAPAGGTLVMSTGMTATLKRVAVDEFDIIGQTVPV